MADLSESERLALEQQLAANPQAVQALIEDRKKGQGGRLKYALSPEQIAQRGLGVGDAEILKRFGIIVPHDYRVGFDPKTGTPAVKKLNWFTRNQDWILPVATIATAGAGAALAGGGAAATGGTAAAAPAATAGTTAATAAGTGAAAAGGGSLLHSLLPTIIGAGANVAGTVIAAKAGTKAAQLQQEAADKALAIQQQQYALQREDSAPYRALGQGAVGNLGYLSGINISPERVTELSSTVPKTPISPLPTKPVMAGEGQAAPRVPQGNLGLSASTGGGGLVSVRNPQTGMVHLIPQDRVAEAQQNGGVVV